MAKTNAPSYAIAISGSLALAVMANAMPLESMGSQNSPEFRLKLVRHLADQGVLQPLVNRSDNQGTETLGQSDQRYNKITDDDGKKGKP